EERGRELVDREHRGALAARAAQLGRLLDLGQLDAVAVREPLGRLDEALALHLHDESEHVALLAAAEADERAAIGRHVERPRLLAVERAQALPAPPRLPELHVLTDHGHDVGRIPDLLLELVGDHRRPSPGRTITMTDPSPTRTPYRDAGAGGATSALGRV